MYILYIHVHTGFEADLLNYVQKFPQKLQIVHKQMTNRWTDDRQTTDGCSTIAIAAWSYGPRWLKRSVTTIGGLKIKKEAGDVTNDQWSKDQQPQKRGQRSREKVKRNQQFEKMGQRLYRDQWPQKVYQKPKKGQLCPNVGQLGTLGRSGCILFH